MRENGFSRVGAADFDTMLASYTIDERAGEHSLKLLAVRYLNAPRWDTEVLPYISASRMGECPRELLWRYNAHDVSYNLALVHVLEKEMDTDGHRVFREILMPASEALLEMELCGVAVDREYLSRLASSLEEELERQKEEMAQLLGIPLEEVNFNSPVQLKHLLYGVAGLPVPVVMGKAEYNTKEETLRRLVGLHPVVEKLLEYRKRQKFYSTYVRAMLEWSEGDGRVHTTFNLAGTRTGRLSSSDPNLQNIGRDAESRNMFVAAPGYTLIEADLSQVEVRVAAYLSQDPVLLEAVNHTDIHTRTACLMFGLAPEQVTKELRSQAKRLTFGLIYQMTPQTLATDLGVSVDEAAALRRRFFQVFPHVEEWWNEIARRVARDHAVKTPFGRVRRFVQYPILGERDRRELVKAAVNFPVQSTASDINLLALIRLHRRARRGELGDTRLLLTVHDSIVLETKEEPLEVARAVREEMLRPVLDGLPLEVEVKIGNRWGELQEVVLK